MGKKRSSMTQHNTFGWEKPPETADIQALRTFKATKDPSIPFNYSKQREEMSNSYQNPLGAYTSPATRDNANRTINQSFAQDEAQANTASQFDADQQNYARQAAIAEMTSPRMVQTGGSGTTVEQGGFWSGLLNSTMQGAGGAALT